MITGSSQWQIHICATTTMLFTSYGRLLNTLRPRQNGRHIADDAFKRIFVNENAWISLQISLKFVPKVRINNIPALVRIMAWRRSGDKPLTEPMMVSLLTHICVTRPQWVNGMAIEHRWAQLRLRLGPGYALLVAIETNVFATSSYERITLVSALYNLNAKTNCFM